MCVTIGFACNEFGRLFLQTIEDSGSGLAVLDRSLRIKETNTAFLEHSGHARDDAPLRHRRLPELLHPTVRSRVSTQFERLADSRHRRFVDRLPALWPHCAGREWDITGMTVPGPDGRVGTFVLLAAPETTGPDTAGVSRPRALLKATDARILEGIATGDTTVQVATNLYLSRQGVEYHVGRMLKQFKVTNRTSLVSKAFSMGLFGVGSWPPRVRPEYVAD
jgi:DNA-binding CsgD family transcriptional regulator